MSAMRPLKRSTIPLVCGVRGKAVDSAQKERKVKIFEEKLSVILEYAMLVMLAVMSIFVGAQMIARLLRLPVFLGWMQELALFLLVIVSFVGGGLCFRNYSHIRITILVDLFKSGAFKKGLFYFSKLASLLYSVIFLIMSYMYCQHLFLVGTKTMTMPSGMNFEIAYVYIPLVACFLINIFYILYHFRKNDYASIEKEEMYHEEEKEEEGTNG
jgi:TRAP-type C4-dicarboxylate transport system permease small subunit